VGRWVQVAISARDGWVGGGVYAVLLSPGMVDLPSILKGGGRIALPVWNVTDGCHLPCYM